MCEGELRQIIGRGNYDLTEEEYLEIISGKTVELCSCCCRLGAHYAGAAGPLEEALGRYGAHLGMAFQIADDLLDVLGDETTTGKSLGTDLLKQKTTLPLIRLLGLLEPAERKSVLTILSDVEQGQTQESLRPWLDKTDAIGYARQRANDFVESTIDQLDDIPQCSVHDHLAGLGRFVITRKN